MATNEQGWQYNEPAQVIDVGVVISNCISHATINCSTQRALVVAYVKQLLWFHFAILVNNPLLIQTFAIHKEGVRCRVPILHVIASPLSCSDFFALCRLCWPCICCNMLNITFLLAAIILCRLCWFYICCNMPNITFLLVANSLPMVKGNSSMGHAWLPAELTMRMEQHKVERIVSRVQVTDPP